MFCMHIAGQFLEERPGAGGNVADPFVGLYIRQFDGAPKRFPFERD
jgi:hypothetical protein